MAKNDSGSMFVTAMMQTLKFSCRPGYEKPLQAQYGIVVQAKE